MSNTAIDLTLGINMQIGSVPLSLAADVESDDNGSIYTFSGCVPDAAIDIGSFMRHVAQQFGVDVALPPELNLQAGIDYVAGQIRYIKPKSGDSTTEMRMAAKFTLTYANGGAAKTFAFQFYADTLLSSGSQDRAYVIGSAIDIDLAFKDLPLVGSIPKFNEYALKHLGFSYTNVDPAQNNGKPVSFTLPKVNASASPLKTAGSPATRASSSHTIDRSGQQTSFTLPRKGFALTAGLIRQGSATAESNFSLPMALPATAPGMESANYYQGDDKVNASPAGSAVHWINVNKTFGPVNLQKIGLNYKDGEATFGLCAGFATGGFALALQGLSITFPLPLPGKPAGADTSFNLDGLAMDFQKGGLRLAGAFLKSDQDGVTNYFGEIAAQVSQFGFTAIGGYTPAHQSDPASFFIYANLQVPLGGPPFLYVTGLAFGFGLNYALNLPTLDSLPGYLLLPGNAPPQPHDTSAAVDGVLTQLAAGSRPVVSNQPGQYWVAAGIQFTSFNMISAFALATVSFGVEMQVALLGAAAITLPKGASSPLAYIEVDLIASFTPAAGAIQIAGVITPASYLWGDFVKISGGFALGIWYGGEHSGDFVFSIGGYHNAFRKPAWYAPVPRLQLGFVLEGFHASGDAYLALTPAMFMAGLRFTATYSAGPFSAWFSAGINFLISWAPFFYRADAYVNVGCSVDLGLFTLRVSVGADLELWGPSFGGKAEIDLCIVSFTIHFGSSKPTPIPVSWNDLESNFLPGARSASKLASARSTKMLQLHNRASANANPRHDRLMTNDTGNDPIVSASVAAGLLKQDLHDSLGRTWNWLIDQSDFQITTATTIPVNQAYWNASIYSSDGPHINVNGPKIPNVLASYDSHYGVEKNIPYLSLSDSSIHFSSTEVWNPNISIQPMKLKNVQSRYVISVVKANNNGEFNDYLSNLKIAPVLGNSNTALWGEPSAKLAPNAPSLLTETLLGFTILALPRHPDTVSNVPLIQLIFTAGNRTSFTGTGLQADQRYQVSASVAPSPSDMTIEISGASAQSFTNHNYILGTLTAPWVSEQRAALLNALVAAGHTTYTPQELDLTAMGSTEILTDWPMVALLGAALAA